MAIKIPKGDDMIYFKNYHKDIAAPLVIYADFEATNEKVYECKPNNDKSYTESYQKHKECGYGYKVVCCYNDKYSKPVQIYRGENAIHKFMEKISIKICRVFTNLENMKNLENSGNLKNCQNLRENSGKFELLWKKPGKLRENEKYVT